ncbi:hypothetical protein SRHO_G00048800 [Serrasalmus rhombeus]
MCRLLIKNLDPRQLSGCMVTDEGCFCLALALKSSPSHLKELDLTYNYSGESGVKLLSDLLEDPRCSLHTLRVEYGGKIRMNSGLKKYACELTLDPDTAHRRLSLSEENRKRWIKLLVISRRPTRDHNQSAGCLCGFED